MIYNGDPKGYTEAELETARRIRGMLETPVKEAAKRGFLKATGKIFPIHEPGTFQYGYIEREEK